MKVEPISITAQVSLGQVEAGEGFGLKVKLWASLSGVSREQAEALVHAAHAVCPYSNATRGNIEVTLEIV